METNSFQSKVIEKTLSEVRTFLDELVNGTSGYKGLHNLTEQVEHQYHGRFLIELIQNAHDALLNPNETTTSQRIEIALVEEEGEHGVLYVANDGIPFTDSNFLALSNLGQSDKDPQKSIGHKGIGFRSVLEVSREPEIFSRSKAGSSSFDGFCFRFTSRVTEQFRVPIWALLNGVDSPSSPLSSEIPLVPWGKDRIEALRIKCRDRSNTWLSNEISFLSPYALPLPIQAEDFPVRVKTYGNEGYATVVRMLLESNDAFDLAREKLSELKEQSIIFLERLDSLKLIVDSRERSFTVEQNDLPGDLEKGREVIIESIALDEQESSKQRYWIWDHVIGGESDVQGIEIIKKAVSKLPGKWPQVTKVKVSLGVRIAEGSEKGMLNIYLPTELQSGCGAHFSGPFFGDISRTNIDFDKPYNALLLESLAQKAVVVIRNSLTGKSVEEARAIIDIVSPADHDRGTLWWNALKGALEHYELELNDQKMVLSDKGWRTLGEVTLLPRFNGIKLLTRDVIREHANFELTHKDLESRENQIQLLFDAVELSCTPSAESLANTVEIVAQALNSSSERTDWNAFWGDIETIFPRNWEPLKGKKILLGNDGELHANDEKTSVFFRPLRLGVDDDEVLSEDAIKDIPPNLRPYIAFLNEDIETHVRDEAGRLKTTDIHRYLSRGLVERFTIEEIFKSVLIKVIPPLPIKNTDPLSNMCRDILLWGLRLILSLVARDRGEGTLTLLGRLPAPCKDGWYRLDETCFGPGWKNTIGNELRDYLTAVDSHEANQLSKKLLRQPDDPTWDNLGERSQELLERCGVMDGLRPITIEPESWESRFRVSSGSGFRLPVDAPPGFPQGIWEKYRQKVLDDLEPRYQGDFPYRVQKFLALPGLDQFDDMTPVTRLAFMTSVLVSIAHWGQTGDWWTVNLRKVGGDGHAPEDISPLFFSLTELQWLIEKTEDDWEFFKPGERWYVSPQILSALKHQYDHLLPVPNAIAHGIEQKPELIKMLNKLGMPIYDPDSEDDSPRLLQDLANALGDTEIEIANINVFVGQVRTAWSNFTPWEETEFPEKLIVQLKGGQLSVITPSEDSPIYLPDATRTVHEGLSLHSKPVLLIKDSEARRLQDRFREQFGQAILFASELDIVPLIYGDTWISENGKLLSDDGFDWIIPLILAIIAHGTEQSKGTETKAFKESTDRLREIKIEWVDEFEAGLVREGTILAKTRVPAIWLPEIKTILAAEKCRTSLKELSDAISSALERPTLDIPLRLVLGNLEDTDKPENEAILKALSELRIHRDEYNEVQQKILGDFAWTMRMLRPMILLISPGSDLTELLDTTSEEDVLSFLSNMPLDLLDEHGVLSIARSASGYEDLGRQLHEVFDAKADLAAWNEILISIGETPVKNDSAESDFFTILNSLKVTIRSILRDHLLRNESTKGLLELEEQITTLEFPEEYANKFWVIPFRSVADILRSLMEELGIRNDVVSALSLADEEDDLMSRLKTMDVHPDIDPTEIAADNFSMLKSVYGDVRKHALAWIMKNDRNPGKWEDDPEEVMQGMLSVFKNEAYLNSWDKSACNKIIKSVFDSELYSDIWDAYESSKDPDELMKNLGISPSDIESAVNRLKEYRSEIEEKKQSVDVCGKPFINTQDNRSKLWDHILSVLPSDRLPDLNLDRLDQLEDLEALDKRKRGRQTKPTRRGRGPKHLSQAMIDLIGLTGEMHGFRALRNIYGDQVVDSSSWISEYSLERYPDNKTNDAYGCDFVIRPPDGKTYYIEVKATQGDDESVELGSSEVRLAVEKAGKRKEVFQILHVLDALSTDPKFRFLPNPYDKKFRTKFRFEEAGLRIRYELSR